MSEGLALRWALFGTFGTNHTNNAAQGIRSYHRTYADALIGLMDDLTTQSPTFDTEMIERFGRELDQRFTNVDVSQMSDWPDDMVSRIQVLEWSRPLPG